MSKQAFFPAAVVLAVVALVAHSVASRLTYEAMYRKAALVAVARQQHITYAPDDRQLGLNSRERVFRTVGLAASLLAVVCMVTAMRRREPGWYLFLALLVCFALAAPLLL